MKREDVKVLSNGTRVYPSIKVTVEINGAVGTRIVELRESKGLFTGLVKGKTTLAFEWNASKYDVPRVKVNGRILPEDKRASAQEMVKVALKAYNVAFKAMSIVKEETVQQQHQETNVPDAGTKAIDANIEANYYN